MTADTCDHPSLPRGFCVLLIGKKDHPCDWSISQTALPSWRRGVLAIRYLGLCGLRRSCSDFPEQAISGDRRRGQRCRGGDVYVVVQEASDKLS